MQRACIACVHLHRYTRIYVCYNNIRCCIIVVVYTYIVHEESYAIETCFENCELYNILITGPGRRRSRCVLMLYPIKRIKDGSPPIIIIHTRTQNIVKRNGGVDFLSLSIKTGILTFSVLTD